MSIERVSRQGGVVWRVRWREGGRERSRVIGRKRDAEAFDAEIRRRRRTGELAVLDAGKQTLAEFAEEWWRLHAMPNLSNRTRATYASLWDLHVLPRLGAFALRELTPEIAQRFAADLAKAQVGPAASRKTLSLLGAVLQRAVEWGKITSNPVRLVRKPPGRPARSVRPLAPATVEALRARLGPRDATLVSVLAYAGLRPGEALALAWKDVGERTLLVHAPKTNRPRSVRLLRPLKADLAEWRLASGRPGGSAPVFPRRDGRAFTDEDWRNWRQRVFAPAARALGFEGARPYDLRHSFVSLLIHEGASVVEVARQAGHAPTMTLSTYAHVIDELDGAERVSAEVHIRQARDELVSVECPTRPATASP